MRRATVLCLLALIVSTSAFAGGQAAKGEKITLNFWRYGALPLGSKIDHEWVDKWNKANPNVQVIDTDQVWDTVFEHFQTAAMSDSLPDVASIHAPFVNAFGAKGGYLEPIDNFKDFQKVKADYVDGFMEGTKFGGHYWGFASSPILFVMLANKAVFDNAGVPKPDDANWTWADFRAIAKKLTKDLNGDGKIDQYGYAIMGGDLGGHAYRIAPLAFMAGGVMATEDFKKSMLNQAPWIEVVQLLADMNLVDKSVDPGFLSDNYGEVVNKFAGDRVAMSIEGPWYPGLVRSSKPGKEIWTLRLPKPAKVTGPGVPGTLSDSSVVVIAKSSKHKAEAWEFLKYITGPAFDATGTNAEVGRMPVTKPSYNLPEWKTFEGWDAYGAMAPNSRPWPYHPALVEITRDVIAQETLKAIKGDVSVAAAMATIDARINEILARK